MADGSTTIIGRVELRNFSTLSPRMQTMARAIWEPRGTAFWDPDDTRPIMLLYLEDEGDGG